MKTIGIVRKLDTLGRVVLPIELRKMFDLKVDDFIEIYVEGSSLILMKYEEKCQFCDSKRQLRQFKKKMICEECFQLLRS